MSLLPVQAQARGILHMLTQVESKVAPRCRLPQVLTNTTSRGEAKRVRRKEKT